MKSPLEWVQDLFGGQCVAYQIIKPPYGLTKHVNTLFLLSALPLLFEEQVAELQFQKEEHGSKVMG